MSIRDLTDRERDIALQCLRYILEGCRFDEIELITRLGVNKAELASIAMEWPEIEDEDASALGYLTLNNCFNEICNGLDFSTDEWQRWFSVPKEEICKTYFLWLQGIKSNSI